MSPSICKLPKTLFPVPSSQILSGFTTYSIKPEAHEITHIELSDQPLGVHKCSPRTSHTLVNPPDYPASHSDISIEGFPHPLASDLAWEANYPKGSINPTGFLPGGFGFYLSGPESYSNALISANEKEVLMSYEVMFQSDWEWCKGGKLPGMFGGVGDLAYKCTGGRQESRCKCFDLRLMWRASGQGELYAYIPLTPNNISRLLAIPSSKQNPDYGFSVGRGLFKFVPGRWMAVAQRVKLNDIGAEDGEIEVYIDGVSIIRVVGLSLRDEPASHVKGLHFQTFFGGHTSDWESPKDQKAWFKSVSGAILRAGSNKRVEL